MKKIAFLTSAFLILTGSAFAHHRFVDEFDAKAPLTLKGIVSKVDWSAPHVMIHADVMDKDGKMKSWSFEAAGPTQLEGKGWHKDTLKPGDTFTVHAYRAKSEPNVAGARTITLADGKKLSAAPNDGGPKA
jgi:hypothetical protein